jgi:hypothetical protein
MSGLDEHVTVGMATARAAGAFVTLTADTLAKMPSEAVAVATSLLKFPPWPCFSLIAHRPGADEAFRPCAG